MRSRTARAQLRNAAPVFAALGDDVRLALMARLSEGMPLSITQLAAKMPITRQAVTKHLHVLQHARLVRSEKSGREQRWQLEAASLKHAQVLLDAITKEWSNSLGRLKAFVEEEEKP